MATKWVNVPEGSKASSLSVQLSDSDLDSEGKVVLNIHPTQGNAYDDFELHWMLKPTAAMSSEQFDLYAELRYTGPYDQYFLADTTFYEYNINYEPSYYWYASEFTDREIIRINYESLDSANGLKLEMSFWGVTSIEGATLYLWFKNCVDTEIEVEYYAVKEIDGTYYLYEKDLYNDTEYYNFGDCYYNWKPGTEPGGKFEFVGYSIDGSLPSLTGKNISSKTMVNSWGHTVRAVYREPFELPEITNAIVFDRASSSDIYFNFPGSVIASGTIIKKATIPNNTGTTRVDHLGYNFTSWQTDTRETKRYPGETVSPIISKYELEEICVAASEVSLNTTSSGAALDTVNRDLYYWSFTPTESDRYTIVSAPGASSNKTISVLSTSGETLFSNNDYILNCYLPSNEQVFIKSRILNPNNTTTQIRIIKTPVLSLLEEDNSTVFETIDIDFEVNDQWNYILPKYVPQSTSKKNFLGWKVSASDTQIYLPGETYTYTPVYENIFSATYNIQLIPVWGDPEVLELNSTFDSNLWGREKKWYKYNSTKNNLDLIFFTVYENYNMEAYENNTQKDFVYNTELSVTDNKLYVRNISTSKTYYFNIENLTNAIRQEDSTLWFGLIQKYYFKNNYNATDTTDFKILEKEYAISLALPEGPWRLGWEFLGWSEQQDGFNNILDLTYNLGDDDGPNFYAQWKCLSSVTVHTKNADNTITPKQVLTYIYKDGIWQTVIPYVYTNGEWKPCAFNAGEK